MVSRVPEAFIDQKFRPLKDRVFVKAPWFSEHSIWLLLIDKTISGDIISINFKSVLISLRYTPPILIQHTPFSVGFHYVLASFMWISLVSGASFVQ